MTLDDLASAAEERIREAELHEHRLKAEKDVLVPCGACYYCTTTVPSNHLFCDSGCRDDYEREQQAKKRNGR